MRRQRPESTVDDTTPTSKRPLSFISCPYLDTVDRKSLDFDFERVCCVSLSNHNVYACLVCGKFYQGRGPHSHAYTHSIQNSHHVFISLDSGRVYCLPDQYEVDDVSLNDIRFNLNPSLTDIELRLTDDPAYISSDLDGISYVPGFIGLNASPESSWLNSTTQALIHVRPFRDGLLHLKGPIRSELLGSFIELIKKVFNPRSFRSQVSPQRFYQAVATRSSNRFCSTRRADPFQYISWFLNTMNRDISKDHKSNIISNTFKGVVNITDVDSEEQEPKEFLCLSFPLPEAPLFKDSNKSTIPQVPLAVLLAKFNGSLEEVNVGKSNKRYRIQKLPKFVIMHFKRFRKNNFFTEKNSTLVSFPLSGLNMAGCVEENSCTSIEDIRCLTITELKHQLNRLNLSYDSFHEKSDLENALWNGLSNPMLSQYDLLSNICHQSIEGGEELHVSEKSTRQLDGKYIAQVFNERRNEWFQFEDLEVHNVIPQLIGLSEVYIQIWKRKTE